MVQRGVCTFMFTSEPSQQPKYSYSPRMDSWINEQSLVYTCNGILISLKSIRKSDTCYKCLSLEDMAMSATSQAEGTICDATYEIPRIRTNSETTVEVVGAVGAEGRSGSSCLLGKSFCLG